MPLLRELEGHPSRGKEVLQGEDLGYHLLSINMTAGPGRQGWGRGWELVRYIIKHRADVVRNLWTYVYVNEPQSRSRPG